MKTLAHALVLPKFRKSRVVATMITRVHNVVASIFILQLSLDQAAAGVAEGEPLCAAAMAGNAALIASLQDAAPAQALSLICSIVIANAPHVRRERVLAHIKQQRTQQLYNKPPVVKGVAARTMRTSLFFVVLKLTVEGNTPADGGCARITAKYGAAYAKLGQVARLQAEDREADPSDEAQRFPLKHTACVPAPAPACVPACLRACVAERAELTPGVFAYYAAGFSPTLP